MIRFACPTCAAVFSVADEKAGKQGKCPKCAAQFMIPGPAVSPPPPPAPAAAENVEIAPCPKCSARLSVGRGDLGADVECPYCKTVYSARMPGDPAPSRRPPPTPLAPVEDERPSRRGRPRDEDDDDEEEEVRPRRKKRKSYREPHRGGTVLTLAILSLLCCGIFTAVPAMIMAGNDLHRMDQGYMDPSGRGQTQAARIIGMIVVGLTIATFVLYAVLIVIGLMVGPPPRGR